MKKLLISIVILGIIFAIPVKGNPYDIKTIAGAALVTTGFVTAYFSRELWKDYSKEKLALSKINGAELHTVEERHNKNLMRLGGSVFAGIGSIFTTTTGLLLLSNFKATGATLLTYGLAGLYFTKNKYAEKLEEANKRADAKYHEYFPVKKEDAHKEVQMPEHLKSIQTSTSKMVPAATLFATATASKNLEAVKKSPKTKYFECEEEQKPNHLKSVQINGS